MVQFVNIIREEVVETQAKQFNGNRHWSSVVEEHSPVYFCIHW